MNENEFIKKRKNLLRDILIDLKDEWMKFTFIARWINWKDYKRLTPLLCNLAKDDNYYISPEKVETILKYLLNK